MEDPSNLQIATEPVAPCQLRMTVEVPEERVRAAMREVARRIANDYNIPGFRKGKAPYEVIIQRFGEKTIRGEAADELIKKVYKEALERENINPYAAGELDTLELQPLRAIFLIPLEPEVDLGDYRALRLEPPAVEVTEAELQSALEEVRQQQAILKPIEGRGAQPGDVLLLDVRGVTDEGTLFLRDEEAEVTLDLDADSPAPGFYQQLVGAQPGEARTFRLAMPNGQPSPEAEFTVNVRGLFEHLLPALDDDLARATGDFDSLEALREHLRAEILAHKQSEAEQEFANLALETLTAQANIAFPPVVLEEELERMVRRFEQLVQNQYHMSLSDYLKAMGRTEKDLRENMKPEAEARARRHLVLRHLIDREGLTVSEEEIAERITAKSQVFGIRAEEMRAVMESEEGRQMVESEILVEKALQRIAAIVRGAATSTEQSAEA